MGFAEKLKEIRKQNHLSQEDLAELLDVSRQSVSKWEQSSGYPEVETLLLLAEKLHVSLDELMDLEQPKAPASEKAGANSLLTIMSPYENVIASCYKVVSSKQFKTGKDEPKYALFGTGLDTHPFWGQANTFLGWYADVESLEKEMQAIQTAITSGAGTYELQYSVKTESRFLKRKIVKE